MNDPLDAYHPVDCGFHDILLHHATLRRPVEVVWDEKGRKLASNAVIVDVYTHDGREFMRLDSGVVIRLDRLISVDGTAAPGGACPV